MRDEFGHLCSFVLYAHAPSDVSTFFSSIIKEASKYTWNIKHQV